MSSVNPMTAIGDIQQIASTMSGLGSQLSAAASSGGFGAVLSQVNSEFADVQDGAGTSSGTDSGAAGSDSTADTEALEVDSYLGGSTLTSASPVPMPASGLYGFDSSLSAGTAGVSPTGESVVADAEQYLGVPYQWGGTSPQTGFDCSGLVQHVYGDLGISLPRTSEEQAAVGTPVDSLADAQPGDLVFFAGSDGTPSSPGHVGIYVGNGQMIDAPETGEDVQIQPVGDPVAIRRVLPAGSAGGSSASALSVSQVDSILSELGASEGMTGATGSTTQEMDSLGVPSGLQPLFEEAGSRYGVDPTLLAAVAKQESGFDPAALSSAGAEGLMQIMPATAAGLGIDPSDPGQAIDGAAQLLSGYLNQYGGSVPLALAAYNAGPGAVSDYGGVPPYAQTQSYVSSITSMLSDANVMAA
jgi:peptidoglycan DL-endopeptidase CwlO